MKKVSFLKHGMEIHSAYVEGDHKSGDPVPVPLVKSGLQDWKTRMGWDDDGHIAAKSSWDQVRVGAQTFSADQFLIAAKNAPSLHVKQGATTSHFSTSRADSTAPLKLSAPLEIPDDWGLVDKVADSKQAFESVRHDHISEAGPVINGKGEIDFAASNEAQLREALQKIGAKPRPPKVDL